MMLLYFYSINRYPLERRVGFKVRFIIFGTFLISCVCLLLHFCIARREMRQAGLTIIFDARKSIPQPQLYKALMALQVRCTEINGSYLLLRGGFLAGLSVHWLINYYRSSLSRQ